MKRRAILFALGSAAAAASAVALRPHRRAAEVLPPIDLATQVPETFDRWRIDTGLVPVLPDPSVQAKLDKIYNQLLARTYIDPDGRRVNGESLQRGDNDVRTNVAGVVPVQRLKAWIKLEASA